MFLNLTPTPKSSLKGQKISPKGQKSAKEAENVVELKTKR